MGARDRAESGAARVIELLLTERPTLHTSHVGPATADWSLGGDCLQLLADLVRPGFVTLETGCGYSTLVFAGAGARHTAITPTATDWVAIGKWAALHEISLTDVSFVDQPSHRGLAARTPGPLDLVLIDGNHAQPVPFVDWFFIADDLVKNGLVVIDDIELPGPAALASFLDHDAERWQRVQQVGRSLVYRKVVDGPVTQLLDNYLGAAHLAPRSSLPRRILGRLARLTARRSP